jgi:hypothetical protein
MTSAALTPHEAASTSPLVVVVCSVPMIVEALRETLATFADVQSFPARTGTAGLLRSIRPAAAVVDNNDDRAEAEDVARELGFPLVHISLTQRRIRVFRGGEWHVAGVDDAVRPETVRDAIAAGLFAKGTG